MRIGITPPDLLPAGEERLRLAAERGHDGDDPDLPVRWVRLHENGRNISVAIGPVEPGGPEHHLWRVLVEIE